MPTPAFGSIGGLLGGMNVRPPPANSTQLQPVIGTNPSNFAGALWNVNGNFNGTTRSPFVVQGLDNFNPNDPRALNPGLVTFSNNTTYRPRLHADLYGAGVRNPFANAFQQYGQALVLSNPVFPTFNWSRRP